MNAELIDYYKNLLIMQYRDKPKAFAHTENIVKSGMIYEIMIAVRDAFGIEDAVGVQQDVLGRILGVSRTITGTTFTRAYYGYALYGDTSPFVFNRMLTYGEAAPDVQFRNYTEGKQSLYNLTDEEYRVIQKLAIVRNNSNASVKTIDDILNALFGSECYFIDRMNMTVVSYMVGSRWSRIFQIAKASGLLPNPAGVGTSLVVVPDIKNIFSYSLYGGAKPEFAIGYVNYFGNWQEKGNGLSISLLYSSITALSSSRIVIAKSGTNTIQAYDFNGVDWSLIGNSLSITGINLPSITALSSSRIAFIDESGSLRTYDFNGVDWSIVGNPLSIGIGNLFSITALSSSRIAVSDSYNRTLRTYDFNGTDWSIIGNSLSVSFAYRSITSLSSSRIAIIDNDSKKIKAYDFNDIDWSIVGNSLSITGIVNSSITTLSLTMIAFIDDGNKELRTYDFNGIDWSLIGNPLSITGISVPSITSLSSSRIAFIDGGNKELQSYDLVKNTTGCLASYS